MIKKDLAMTDNPLTTPLKKIPSSREQGIFLSLRKARGVSSLNPFIFLPAVLLMLIIIMVFVWCVNAEEIYLDIIATIESSGNPYAVSPAGCIGLYQISEIALKDYNNYHKKTPYLKQDLFNFETNRKIAIWLFEERIPQLLRHYKKDINLTNILWAYNAGIGKVVKGILPQETIKYIKRYKTLLARKTGIQIARAK